MVKKLISVLLLGALLFMSGESVSVTTSGKAEVKAAEKPVYYRDKVLVLMYHHIDQNENGASISPERFNSHMQMLADKGYNVISIDQYMKSIQTHRPLPDNAVIITFDDGYESFYTYAYPVLKHHKFPAAHFIIVRASDEKLPGALPHLTWDQMREMKQNGMNFYNHTYDQHGFGEVNPQKEGKPVLSSPLYFSKEKRYETQHEYETRIYQDLKHAEERLDHELGKQRNYFAYPYGAYNETVTRVAQSLGIQLFFTVEEGINDRNQLQMKRLNAGGPGFTADALLTKMAKYNENAVAAKN